MTIQEQVSEHSRTVMTVYPYIVFTGLFGSQNYNLADKHSDVDTKSIILPSKKDWLFGDFEYSDIVMPDKSHAEVKDLVAKLKQFDKGNINFLEILYTPYVAVNPYFKEINENKFVPEYLGLIVNGIVIYHVNWIDIVEKEIVLINVKNLL